MEVFQLLPHPLTSLDLCSGRRGATLCQAPQEEATLVNKSQDPKQSWADCPTRGGMDRPWEHQERPAQRLAQHPAPAQTPSYHSQHDRQHTVITWEQQRDRAALAGVGAERARIHSHCSTCRALGPLGAEPAPRAGQPTALSLTLQGFFGSGQLLLLLGQLDPELGGREDLGGLAALRLLQVLGQHLLHLPEKVHFLLEPGHFFSQ